MPDDGAKGKPSQDPADLPDFVPGPPAIVATVDLLLYDAQGNVVTSTKQAVAREPLAAFATRMRLPVDAVREVNREAFAEDGSLLPGVYVLNLPKTTP